jgi:hypothetical protein
VRTKGERTGRHSALLGAPATSARRGLPVVEDEVPALDEYPAALERLEGGQQLGKLALRH